MTSKPDADPLIGLVGPCKSGKTALQRNLSHKGYRVKHIAQEHSYVKDMWEKIGKPDILTFLDASYATTLKRSSLSWTEKEYQVQLDRLAHAREKSDLIIDTNDLSREEVFLEAFDYLIKWPDRNSNP